MTWRGLAIRLRLPLVWWTPRLAARRAWWRLTGRCDCPTAAQLVACVPGEPCRRSCLVCGRLAPETPVRDALLWDVARDLAHDLDPSWSPYRDASHTRCPRCDSRLIERRRCAPPECTPHVHWRCPNCGWTEIAEPS